jgi:HEAT repeat protein
VLSQGSATREKGGRQGWRLAAARFLLPCSVCLALCGCASFWDDVTSQTLWRDHKFSTLFIKPNPLLVLRDSTDGDQRARALRALHEPKQEGGTDAEQDVIVKILTTAASSEKQPLCRMAAVETLGHFKDSRVADGLKEAFFNASAFASQPETVTFLRCQILTSLGETKNPAAVDLLVRSVRQPPADGPEQDKQQTMDIRIAAARALANFNNYPATEALVAILQTEKDVALRDRAHESLVAATGKDLPADPKAWDDLIHQRNDAVATQEPAHKLQLLGWFTGSGSVGK